MENEIDARAQQRLIMLMLGAMDAHKCAIEAIIASHPRPDWLRDTWHQSKPEWIDDSERKNVFRSKDFQEGFVQALSAFSQSIDTAEEISRPDGQVGPGKP
ncbi:MAG: hypothetical protein ACREP4_01120 [Stenotrophomonas sp.]|uniref:hypothetical protein n=1 Tax=Stenotrophomonas sp. TaxID=69392 RepID=UPI003D6D74B3